MAWMVPQPYSREYYQQRYWQARAVLTKVDQLVVSGKYAQAVSLLSEFMGRLDTKPERPLKPKQLLVLALFEHRSLTMSQVVDKLPPSKRSGLDRTIESLCDRGYLVRKETRRTVKYSLKRAQKENE